MNDQEVTMHQPLQHRQAGLKAQALSAEVAGLGLKLAGSVPPALRFLADQLCRALCSVPLNLAEGHGWTGRGSTTTERSSR